MSSKLGRLERGGGAKQLVDLSTIIVHGASSSSILERVGSSADLGEETATYLVTNYVFSTWRFLDLGFAP